MYVQRIAVSYLKKALYKYYCYKQTEQCPIRCDGNCFAHVDGNMKIRNEAPMYSFL